MLCSGLDCGSGFGEKRSEVALELSNVTISWLTKVWRQSASTSVAIDDLVDVTRVGVRLERFRRLRKRDLNAERFGFCAGREVDGHDYFPLGF